MKNQYFGDINDYLKYGLLRCFADSGLRIGICWMLTRDDERTDGRKTEYLSKPDRWRAHDPILFDALAQAINRQSRHVRHVHKPMILPNASFYCGLVPDGKPSRTKWLTRTLSSLGGVDLLFFDPDNGIEVKSTPSGKAGSSKYLYWPEIERAWAQESSLIIFQHFPRQKRGHYVAQLANQLAVRLPDAVVVPLITSNVLYLLAYRQRHKTKVELALQFMNKRWADQIRSL